MDKYIIFGTGSIAKRHYEKIASIYGENAVECFIDSMLQKTEFCGKVVIRPSQLKDKDMNSYKYLLGSLTSKTSMLNELKTQGVSEDNIVIDRDYGSNSFESNVKLINKILIYPEIENIEVLRELDNQFSCLVPNLEILNTKPEVIYKEANIETNNFKLISEINDNNIYDLVLVWDKSRLEDKEMKNIEHIYCIDPYYFRMINIRILLRLNYILETEEEHIEYRESSRDNYQKFLEEYKNNTSYVFGAGPSCRDGLNTVFETNAVKIGCNNMVDNRELLEKISPNVYVLSEEDAMSQGYIRMIEKIQEYAINNNCILAVPEIIGAVLVKRYPQLKEKIVRFSFNSDIVNFPTPENMAVYRKAYNVITVLAIPIASSVSTKIYIAGCDGVDLENHEFSEVLWNYTEELNENKSFKFSIRKNEENWEKEYYLKHISYFEDVLDYGEKLGREYISYTNSFIPALQKRKYIK